MEGDRLILKPKNIINFKFQKKVIRKVDSKRLFNSTKLLLQSYGLQSLKSKRVSKYLVDADLSGQSSHGVARLAMYLDKVEKKEINIKAKSKIYNETKNTAQVDGGWGFGQIAADDAIKLCIKKALKKNISCVTLKKANHIGRLSDFTSQAAKKNLIGIAFANLHGTGHVVSPFGGIDRKLPTNPISISTPGPSKTNFFEMDMSTSIISEGKMKIDYLLKKKINKNLIIDYLGKSTRDPKKFYENPKGSILPLGGISGYKGFALSMAVDILGGALSGAGCSGPQKAQHGNAVTFIVIKITAFASIRDFKKKISDLISHVKNTRMQKGFKKILIPGDFERNNKSLNLKRGVEINQVTLNEIRKLLKKKKIKVHI